MLKNLIEQILYYHELEKSGKWRYVHPHTDYSKSSFKVFLEDQTCMSLEEFRLKEKVIFKHRDEVERDGLGIVCKKYYQFKYKAFFERE